VTTTVPPHLAAMVPVLVLAMSEVHSGDNLEAKAIAERVLTILDQVAAAHQVTRDETMEQAQAEADIQRRAAMVAEAWQRTAADLRLRLRREQDRNRRTRARLVAMQVNHRQDAAARDAQVRDATARLRGALSDAAKAQHDRAAVAALASFRASPAAARAVALLVQDAAWCGRRGGMGIQARRHLDAIIQAAVQAAGLPALATIPRPPIRLGRAGRSSAKRAANGPPARTGKARP